MWKKGKTIQAATRTKNSFISLSRISEFHCIQAVQKGQVLKVVELYYDWEEVNALHIWSHWWSWKKREVFEGEKPVNNWSSNHSSGPRQKQITVDVNLGRNILFGLGSLWLRMRQLIGDTEVVLLRLLLRLMFPILCWIRYSTNLTCDMLTQTFETYNKLYTH